MFLGFPSKCARETSEIMPETYQKHVKNIGRHGKALEKHRKNIGKHGETWENIRKNIGNTWGTHGEDMGKTRESEKNERFFDGAS